MARPDPTGAFALCGEDDNRATIRRPMKHLLDNVIWNTLTGPHAVYSVGTDVARRYAPGFTPIVGFANPACPDFDSLAPFCASGKHFYVGGWSGSAPAGWRIDAESSMFQMVWEAAAPATDEAADAVPLGASGNGTRSRSCT